MWQACAQVDLGGQAAWTAACGCSLLNSERHVARAGIADVSWVPWVLRLNGLVISSGGGCIWRHGSHMTSRLLLWNGLSPGSLPLAFMAASRAALVVLWPCRT